MSVRKSLWRNSGEIREILEFRTSGLLGVEFRQEFQVWNQNFVKSSKIPLNTIEILVKDYDSGVRCHLHLRNEKLEHAINGLYYYRYASEMQSKPSHAITVFEPIQSP
jgi:hypothetical protein